MKKWLVQVDCFIKERERIIIALCVVVLIGIISFMLVSYSDYMSKVDSYNEYVSDYNVLAEGYISLIQTTSVENIDGMPTELHYKKELKKNFSSFLQTLFSTLGSGIDNRITGINTEMEDLVSEYMIAEQITNPSADWIEGRLNSIDTITGTQKVTEDNDPNGFLGAEGGYTGCVYFTVADIDSNTIQGTDIVAKGADAGGAVEIYENEEDAMIRCEYLKGFDNTLLYSGSYAIVGTMVIRTSYILSNEDQVELTEKITENLISLE